MGFDPIVRKVKAHVEVGPSLTDVERADACGNDAADAAAKQMARRRNADTVSSRQVARLHAFLVQCMKTVIGDLDRPVAMPPDPDSAVGHSSSIAEVRIDKVPAMRTSHPFCANDGLFVVLSYFGLRPYVGQQLSPRTVLGSPSLSL